MRVIKGTACFIAFLWLFALHSQAQDVTVVARADSTQLLIGSALGLEIEMIYPESVEPLWPIWQAQLGSFLVIEQEEIEKRPEGDKLLMRQKLTLMSFDSGYQQIPIIQLGGVNGKDTFARNTQPIGIEVYTMAVDTSKAFMPLIEPLDAPVVFREVLPYLVFALLLIAIAVFIWWYRRYKKRKELAEFVEQKPRILPQVIARQRLHELESAKLWQQGNIKGYYSELSNILREYLENRYRILALESTTDEILGDLQQTRFPQKYALGLQNFLETADLTKFAKFKPGAADCQESFQEVNDWIKNTQLSTFEALEVEWGIRNQESETSESV